MCNCGGRTVTFVGCCRVCKAVSSAAAAAATEASFE